MTTHYVDLAIVPTPETSAPQLMSALYERLHLALVRNRMDDIGVSFPHYSVVPKTLGHVLRIHGTESALCALMATNWLKGVRDHLHMTAIMATPHDASHRIIKRKQFKTSVERLRRRRMRRKTESEERAAQMIPASVERTPNLPYVHIHSHSTGQKFCLYIAMAPVQGHSISGQFNAYGLSTHTTVPWF